MPRLTTAKLSVAWSHRSARAVVWAASALLATALALPAVWWRVLHEDELVTLDIAPRSFDTIVDAVFVRRGGAPLHFFLEHFLLAWPGGVVGLRLPSLVLFLIALPAAGLVAERLTGETAARLLVPVLAAAPLAVGLATFGRMYTLFLAAVLWTTLFALVAAERGRPLLWAAAGAALGALVYVHPIAPLSIGIALLAALLHGWTDARSAVRTAWPAPIAAVVVGLPFYLHSISVLRVRYDVFRGREALGTEPGSSVPAVSLESLVPGGTPGQIAFLLLAAVGIASLARSRPRSAAVIALWIVVPVAFFTLVPSEGTLFFPRYLIPSLPYALLAVVAGGLALARRGGLGGTGRVAAALAVISLFASEVYADVDRLRTTALFELPEIVDAVAEHREDGVLFSSFEAPHLDRSVVLEVEGLRHVESRCSRLVPYLDGPAEARRGIWLLTGNRDVVAAGSERLRRRDDVELERFGRTVMLVVTSRPAGPRDLLTLGRDLRATWFGGDEQPHVTRGARRETLALTGRCRRF